MQCPMCYNPMNFIKSKDLKKYLIYGNVRSASIDKNSGRTDKKKASDEAFFII